MKSPIHFGTSGWRGLIARDFTFEHLRLAAQGLALTLKSELRRKNSPIHGKRPLVVIGHDTRFLGREFALATAEILQQAGLEPLLTNRDAPTPVIAFSIRHKKAIGGVNITASHNPFGYSGFKFSMPNGAGAPPEFTGKIEAHAEKLLAKGWQPKTAVIGTFSCPEFDPAPAYLRRIRKLVDLQAIGKAKLRIAVELMHGTGRGYLDTLLEEAGSKVTCFHENLNPLFGGGSPEPNESGMAEAAKPILRLASTATPTASASWIAMAPGSRQTRCSPLRCITSAKIAASRARSSVPCRRVTRSMPWRSCSA